MRKKFVKTLAGLTLAIFTGVTGCGKQAVDEGPVVATYQGGEIRQGEFQKQLALHKIMNPDFQETDKSKKEFLEEYILQQKIMVAKAKQMGAAVDANKVNTTASNYKAQLVQFVYGGDQKKLEDQMKNANLKEEDFKNLVQNLMYVQEYQKKKREQIKPSEDEIKNYYETHKNSFAQATVHHILTKTKQEAEIVKLRIIKGEDFAKVAKEVSIDPSAKQNGGKMEGPLGQYVAPFRDAAAQIEIGKVSDPVETRFGFHILKVEKRGEPDPYDKVQEIAKDQFVMEKMEADFEQMKKDANIKISIA